MGTISLLNFLVNQAEDLEALMNIFTPSLVSQGTLCKPSSSPPQLGRCLCLQLSFGQMPRACR